MMGSRQVEQGALLQAISDATNRTAPNRADGVAYGLVGPSVFGLCRARKTR
jgi:hypothetical protein